MGSGACAMAGAGDSVAVMPSPDGRMTSRSASAAGLGAAPPLSAVATWLAHCPLRPDVLCWCVAACGIRARC